MNRKQIGYVEATVRLPIYEGDKTSGDFPWFEYVEPGITKDGDLGVCRRECVTVKATFHQEG